jgi:hypothetical protein
VAVAEAHAAVVAVEHLEDGVASATVADVVDLVEVSVVAVVAAVASQEAEVVVDSHEVVAAVDVVAEATRVAPRLTWSFSLRGSSCATQWSISSLFWSCFECHDYYQPIPRSSFDGVLELRRDLCKRSDMWRHAGNCLRRLLGTRI